MSESKLDLKKRRIREFFSTFKLKYKDKVLTIGDGNVGPMADKLFNAIQDIQYGKSEDPFEWIEPV